VEHHYLASDQRRKWTTEDIEFETRGAPRTGSLGSLTNQTVEPEIGKLHPNNRNGETSSMMGGLEREGKKLSDPQRLPSLLSERRARDRAGVSM